MKVQEPWYQIVFAFQRNQFLQWRGFCHFSLTVFQIKCPQVASLIKLVCSARFHSRSVLLWCRIYSRFKCLRKASSFSSFDPQDTSVVKHLNLIITQNLSGFDFKATKLIESSILKIEDLRNLFLRLFLCLYWISQSPIQVSRSILIRDLMFE